MYGTSSHVICASVRRCEDELLYGNLYVCTVRAHDGFMQFSSALVSRNESFTWNQYACVPYANTCSQELYSRYCLCIEFRNLPLPARGRKRVLVGQWSGKIEVQYRCICLSGESSGTCTMCLSPRPRLVVPLGYPRCRVLEPTNCTGTSLV